VCQWRSSPTALPISIGLSEAPATTVVRREHAPPTRIMRSHRCQGRPNSCDPHLPTVDPIRVSVAIHVSNGRRPRAIRCRFSRDPGTPRSRSRQGGPNNGTTVVPTSRLPIPDPDVGPPATIARSRRARLRLVADILRSTTCRLNLFFNFSMITKEH
jgi:hypothetical protein